MKTENQENQEKLDEILGLYISSVEIMQNIQDSYISASQKTKLEITDNICLPLVAEMLDKCREQTVMLKGDPSVYQLFSTDEWKSSCSYELIGIYTTRQKALQAAEDSNLKASECEIEEVTLNESEEVL